MVLNTKKTMQKHKSKRALRQIWVNTFTMVEIQGTSTYGVKKKIISVCLEEIIGFSQNTRKATGK